jgi:hypothetical protein
MGDNESTMMPGRRTGAAAQSVTDQVSAAVNPKCPIHIDAPMAINYANCSLPSIEWNTTQKADAHADASLAKIAATVV